MAERFNFNLISKFNTRAKHHLRVDDTVTAHFSIKTQSDAGRIHKGGAIFQSSPPQTVLHDGLRAGQRDAIINPQSFAF